MRTKYKRPPAEYSVAGHRGHDILTIVHPDRARSSGPTSCHFFFPFLPKRQVPTPTTVAVAVALVAAGPQRSLAKLDLHARAKSTRVPSRPCGPKRVNLCSRGGPKT